MDTIPPDLEKRRSFRGFELKASDFNTALVHFYRAEIQRSNVWRTRLDTTTNWAIITAGAAISFALTSAEHHHAILLINSFLIALFLFIEARRDRYFELWAYRTRLMEKNFFAALLVPPQEPASNWTEDLAASLRNPQFTISMWEAVGRRFRRNYVWIFLTLAASWILKITTQPTSITTWSEFAARAAIGPIPGEWVVITGGALLLTLFAVGLITIPLRNSTGEVFDNPPLGQIIRSRAKTEKAQEEK